nr:MAG TPA: hypothetical protein [Caudoviricetes sp.]
MLSSYLPFLIKMIYTPPDTPVVGVSGIYDVCDSHTSI